MAADGRFRGEKGDQGDKGEPGLHGSPGGQGPPSVVDYEKLANDPALVATIVKQLKIRVVFLDQDGIPSKSAGSEPQVVGLDGGVIQIPAVRLRIYDGAEVFDQAKPLGQRLGIEVRGLLDASSSKGGTIGAAD